ncbi:MAG TPA: TIGR03618 family F420-dependent PPOX class oxidoreductase [Nocardioides sp.]
MPTWTPDWTAVPAPLATFFAERHLATLTTLRPDGRPHLVPVGLAVDAERACAWVITFPASRKARNVVASPGGPVAVCHVDGRRWVTLEGTATATTEPEDVARAVERYAARYRRPKDRPDRVAIRIDVTRVLHSATL